MGQDIRGRFAPSPSGRMHLGNLFAALLAWLAARAEGGTLVLRMEDLDPDRCREEYAVRLAEDLAWLGLDWDEGYGKGGPHGPYRQSERTGQYAAAFRRLEEQGLVYPCFCTRAERLAASAPHRGMADPPCPCRNLSAAEREKRIKSRRPAWRAAAGDCGDFIVRRSDGVYAYQLAVVVDDGGMGITQVVRGRDLLSSTPKQRWLYQTLGLTPPDFYHVPLLLAPDGRRLSKRDRDLDMEVLRERYSPQALAGFLAFLAGQLDRPEPVSPQALADCFSWEKVPQADLVVPPAFFR